MLANVPLILTFSEPMDKSSTQAAFELDDMASDNLVFIWNGDATKLSVTLPEPLRVVSGYPSTPAKSYTFRVRDSAKSVRGTKFAQEESFTFKTERALKEVLGCLPPSGNVDELGGTTSAFAPGARATPITEIRTLCSHHLSSPARIVTKVTLSVAVNENETTSHNFARLGDLYFENLKFAQAGKEAFDAKGGTLIGTATALGLYRFEYPQEALDELSGPFIQWRARFQMQTRDRGQVDFSHVSASIQYIAP